MVANDFPINLRRRTYENFAGPKNILWTGYLCDVSDLGTPYLSMIKPDKQWRLFNARLQELMKDQNFWGLGSTYYEMAKFMDEEGKDSAPLRKLGYEIKLKVGEANLKRFLQSNVVTGVEIIATTDSCEFCKKLNGVRFPIAEAASSKLLPVKECTHLFGCRCVYGPCVE